MELSHLFVLFVLLTSSAWADDPIQIEVTSTTAVAGLLGCPLKSSSPPMNVRFNAIKTKAGSLFNRKTIAADLFAHYEAVDSQGLTAANIKVCAEATEAADLQMFRWEGNACTGYSQGIPKDMNCKTNEDVVLYSVDGGARGPEIFTLTLHQSVSSIWAEWQKRHPDFPTNAVKFELTWNGTVIFLNETTFAHRLQHASFCSNDFSQLDSGLKEVTLVALDASDTPVMEAVTETLVATPVSGSRYLLSSGNCMYYDDAKGATHDVLDGFCSGTLYGTMFMEYKDGDFATYSADLTALGTAVTPPVLVSDHYVGLRKTAGQWTWLNGHPLSINPPLLVDTMMSGDCAAVGPQDLLYISFVCGHTGGSFICHEFLL